MIAPAVDTAKGVTVVYTCKYGMKTECDGCGYCNELEQSKHRCPMCHEKLYADYAVYTQDGQVIGCEICVVTSDAGTEQATLIV